MNEIPSYFAVEIFPKLGPRITSLSGGIGFYYQNKQYSVIVENKPVELKITNSSKDWSIISQYNPVNLYINTHIQDKMVFAEVEMICDILSLATGNHIAYFTHKIDEYSYVPSWVFFEKGNASINITDKLTHKDTEADFLDTGLLYEFIQKIDNSKYKEMIYASLHMNRLAKYKSFSHITEAITDCVNSVEALYMREDRNYQSKPDSELIPKDITAKGGIFEYFLRKYYPGQESDLSIVKEIDPYKTRSAYLHRGILQGPESTFDGFASNQDIKTAEKLLTYNGFYKVVFSTILNFVMQELKLKQSN